MIKAVIFDMDGVLVDAKDWHYEALNQALGLFGYKITRYEHLTTFDGLPTKRKLEILSVDRGLPRSLHNFINDLKQQYTMDLVQLQCKPRFSHEFALSHLKRRGLKVGVASNSIRSTIEVMMEKSKLTEYLDIIVSNQDVTHSKPDPEMYIKAMKTLGILPNECLIIEDNEHGIRAAKASGGHVLEVTGVEEVTIENIDRKIAMLQGKLS